MELQENGRAATRRNRGSDAQALEPYTSGGIVPWHDALVHISPDVADKSEGAC